MSRTSGGLHRVNWGDDDTGAHILHVDMDAFFAAVEILDGPELAGLPVIVGGRDRGVVTSATYEARARGIHAAMPIAQAKRLCPEGVFLAGRLERYREVSRDVMEVLRSITPRLEQISIDEAFLDVGGATRLLGRPLRIGAAIRHRIRAEVGIPASVGLAATKHVAKLASTRAKPDGMLLIPAASTVPFLHSLPVEALWGVGDKTRRALEARGVTRVCQLAEIPPRALAGWIGESLAAKLLELAAGKDPRQVKDERVDKSVGTERTFLENVSERAQLERTVLRQAHECAARLRAARQCATRVVIKVRFFDFRDVSRSHSLSAPTQVGAELAAVARGLLAGLALPGGGVRLIGVRVEGLCDAGVVGQQETLDGSRARRQAEGAMDAIRERFGAGTVDVASLLRTENDRGG